MTHFADKFKETIVAKGPLKGARIITAPFPSKDVVSIVGSVAGGTRAVDKAGFSREVPTVHAAMLMEGTRRRKKSVLQTDLDGMGAELSWGVSADRLNF
jgi:hypothetical protein